MTFFQLQCFVSVSNTLNFTKSAADLYISQPALSKSISALEQELEIRLLIRSTRSVSLTAAGQLFAAECAQILRSFEQGLTRAKQAVTGTVGTLKLGFQHDTFESFTVDLVRAFTARHPEITVELFPYSPTQLIRALECGDLDAIIAGDHAGFTPTNHLLLSSRIECAALPEGHPLAGQQFVRIEDLKEENFVTMSPVASRLGFESLIQKTMNAGYSPRIVAQVDHVPSLMMLIACGKGVSILYKDLEKWADNRVVFVPLEDAIPFRRWLIWNESNINPSLKHLISIAESCC